MHGCAVAQRALCELRGRFGALRVITHVMTAASIGASRGGGYARYLESKTVEPERGDYYLTPDGEMAQAPGRWLADAETLERLGVQAGRAGGWRGLHRADGGPTSWDRPLAATRGRRWRPGRRDRRDVQRPEVRLDGVGARRSVAARADRAGPRPRGRADDPPPARAGAGRAPPLQRPGRGRARQGRDRNRVPAHDRTRSLGRSGPGPAAAQPRRHHRRRPRGRPDRGRRVAADLPQRSGAGRVLPLRARRGARARGVRDRAGHGEGWPVLRDRGCAPGVV